MSDTKAKFVTVKHAAEHFDTSPSTIRRWINRGLINGYGEGTRFLRVRISEIEAMLSGQRVKVAA
ncbi:helix-turn-helix domain-containing protein [Corynebacterium variabile]|uniref:helix-turn-helix domain-containing protein n=1 Tax=Corynebacterium variabile TaxID=1727 RepID=UPI003A951492